MWKFTWLLVGLTARKRSETAPLGGDWWLSGRSRCCTSPRSGEGLDLLLDELLLALGGQLDRLLPGQRGLARLAGPGGVLGQLEVCLGRRLSVGNELGGLGRVRVVLEADVAVRVQHQRRQRRVGLLRGRDVALPGRRGLP